MTMEAVTSVRRGPVVPEVRRPGRVRATIARGLFERTVARLPLRVELAERSGDQPRARPGAPVMVIERDAFWRRLGARRQDRLRRGLHGR